MYLFFDSFQVANKLQKYIVNDEKICYVAANRYKWC